MSNQRFTYYTGYEEDDESSHDEEDVPCAGAIADKDANAGSSSDEFDEPLRKYIQTTLSGAPKDTTKASNASKTFANEMEDELDEIYNNFISRGTFDLPISTQKSQPDKNEVANQQDESASDDENDRQNISNPNENDQEQVNDDLLYDPDEEEEDEKWMTNERLKARGIDRSKATNPEPVGPTDAVLNCPGCMVLVCHDCQRHETKRNQYRAMFVFNCTIDENRNANVSSGNKQKSLSKNKKHSNKRLKTEGVDPVIEQEEQNSQAEAFRPVLCSECGTELGVYELKDELYHFTNVLASH